MGSIRHKLAALLLGLGLLGGGVVAAEVAAAPVHSPGIALAAAQATPGATPGVADPQCLDEQNENGEKDAAGDTDNVQDENGADDAIEGDTEEGDSEEDDTAEGSTEEGAEDADENGSDEQADDGAEQDAASATPGTLTQGQDLLPQAKITVDAAVATAQGEATGDLGSVELEERDGTLVFEVTVGDQEVFVDAATGAVISVEPVQNAEADCENEAEGAPGTLVEGQDLLPQTTITLEQSITTAQGKATGDLGTVELEQDGGTLVFIVEIGDQEVTVDAATGEVLSVDQDD